MTDYNSVITKLGEVAEIQSILNSGCDLPLHNFRDIDSLLNSISVSGTFLTAEELSTVRKSLLSMSELRSFLSNDHQEGNVRNPLLSSVSNEIMTFKPIVQAIDNVIDQFGMVKDNASAELAQIRRQLSSMSGTINSVMKRVLANAIRDGFVESDVTPTIRDGRLVLPIAPMFKRKISGIVHDESSTGKTIYIEPAEVVEANNRLRELQMDERREIKRILITISDQLRPHIGEMIHSAEIMGYLDFVHGKALYSKEIDAVMPHVSPDPEMELFHACHPVLREALRNNGKEIVPLNITLSDKNRILLISGPNAGGKSVCLKTVGILQYMMQCGILPAVYENSRMGIFDDVFMDIGDDQSIEDDLSTYSSHLRNMRQIIQRAGQRSMVLIDEFGSGTEPQIGGAIAQAMLKRINASSVWGVITTHYQNLKKYADDTPGLINGSMLYDRQKMIPLFQLAIGHPGSSFAIEIARKTGLPADLIADAEEIVGSDYINMDKYLLDIARDRRYWENKRQAIRQKEKKIEETLEKYTDYAEELKQRRREIIAEAKEEAKAILDGSNKLIERTIHDIRKRQAEKEATAEVRKQMKIEKDELLSKNDSEHVLLKQVPKSRKKKSEKTESVIDASPIVVGDIVKLEGEGIPGKVIEIKGKNAVVIFGQIKTTVALKRLKHTLSKIPSGSIRKESFVSTITETQNRTRQLDFSRQIDVRGMRVDEALQAITYYIDDAIQFNADKVRILHGTGTGALRQAIREYLDTVKGVKSFHDEHVQFGGAGITVVEIE